jgi:hypothetical protein
MNPTAKTPGVTRSSIRREPAYVVDGTFTSMTAALVILSCAGRFTQIRNPYILPARFHILRDGISEYTTPRPRPSLYSLAPSLSR